MQITNPTHYYYYYRILSPHSTRGMTPFVCPNEIISVVLLAQTQCQPIGKEMQRYTHTHTERERERERERDFGEKERVGVSFFWSFWSLYFPTLNLMMRLLSETIPYKYPYISHYSCIARLKLKTRPDKEIWNECTRI